MIKLIPKILSWGIAIFGVLFCLSVNAQVNNNLKVEYLDKFPGAIDFNNKYQDFDKYIVYKYVKFSFVNDIKINTVNINFIVDKKWYKENNIEGIIFLKYSNDEWSRVNYSEKRNENSYIKYEVESSGMPKYWAILGVLANGSEIKSEQTKKTNFKTKIGRSNNKAREIISTIDEMLIGMQSPVVVKGASTALVTTSIVSVSALAIIIGGPTSIWILLQQIILGFLSLFSAKKRHRSGVVYDASTGKPVQLARVDLVDKSTDRTKATKFTDKEGRYFFLAPEGKYYLEVRKKGYKLIKKEDKSIFKALYHKSDLERMVDLNEDGIIKKNVAIINKNGKESISAVKKVTTIIIKHLISIIFFISLVVSVIIYYNNPTAFNFVVVLIYILIMFFKFIFTGKQKYGIIVNRKNKPEAFATINVLDAKTKKMAARAISDTKGHYYMTLEEGLYILNIKTVKGVSTSKKIKVVGKNILAKKIIIKK
jgi:hypothetical protein